MAQVENEKGGKKADKKKELDELNELFKPVVAAQKVSKGDRAPEWRRRATFLLCEDGA